MSNGALLWEGFSRLDGGHVMVIATGLRSRSENPKTGAMIQTYILRADASPTEAIKSGADVSICGGCRHRGFRGHGRTCYVNVGQGPLAVWRAHQRGEGYPSMGPDRWRELFSGRLIRFGTYGDPAAAPSWVWSGLAFHAAGWTGYTHQWREPWAKSYQPYCMASVDSLQELQEAQAMGWRTFRVSQPGDLAKVKGEVLCPASEAAGRKLQCHQCRACSGAARGAKGSIMIPAHGSFATMANFRKGAA